MKAIVCVDKNWGIGKDGGMLFHLPEDLKFFKEKTLGKKVLMGYNTFMSLPKSQPLAGRENIVLSKNHSIDIEGVKVFASTQKLFEYLKDVSQDVFLIGGEMIYKEFLPLCDSAFVTLVQSDGNAQKFFPNLDEDENWEKTFESEEQESGGHIIKFLHYKNTGNKYGI